jgi:hypothetical protein
MDDEEDVLWYLVDEAVVYSKDTERYAVRPGPDFDNGIDVL